MKTRIVPLFSLLFAIGILGSCDWLLTSDSSQERADPNVNRTVFEISLLVGQTKTVSLAEHPDFRFVQTEYDVSVVSVTNLAEAMSITLLSELDETYEIGFVAMDSNGQTLLGSIRLIVLEDLEQDFEIQLIGGLGGRLNLSDEYPDFRFVSAAHDNSIVLVNFAGPVMDVFPWVTIEQPYLFDYQAINDENGQRLFGRIAVIPSQ
ncbi:MAG: hypothetical protein EA384_14455 [Spirochaetaceae bacterium]|nr:MAG: hypothetical protein EA384_14455 [Spirochaetaceae bacterium]